jgi:predicted TPR repeat methyltransferase
LPADAPHALQLRASGRYAHRADHIDTAFAQAGLQLAPLEPLVLRLEAGQGVAGGLGLAAKPAA